MPMGRWMSNNKTKATLLNLSDRLANGARAQCAINMATHRKMLAFNPLRCDQRSVASPLTTVSVLTISPWHGGLT